MSGFDRLIQKVPGSLQVKAFVSASLLCIALGYPIFRSTDGRQGHDYFSQERPEAILKGEEESRQKYLMEREQRREQRRANETSEQ